MVKKISVSWVHNITPTPIMTLKYICQIYKLIIFQKLADMNRLLFEAIKNKCLQIGEW